MTLKVAVVGTGQVSGHKTYTQLARYTHLRPSSILAKLG